MDREIICVDTSIFIDYFRKRNKEKPYFMCFLKSMISQFPLLQNLRFGLEQTKFKESIGPKYLPKLMFYHLRKPTLTKRQIF